jgi:D-sedoheptulose 7-phosphate isomerase
MGMRTVFLGGKDGGAAKGLCSLEIIVPSNDTARIQEVHTLILHTWLSAVDAGDWDEVSRRRTAMPDFRRR